MANGGVEMFAVAIRWGYILSYDSIHHIGWKNHPFRLSSPAGGIIWRLTWDDVRQLMAHEDPRVWMQIKFEVRSGIIEFHRHKPDLSEPWMYEVVFEWSPLATDTFPVEGGLLMQVRLKPQD